MVLSHVVERRGVLIKDGLQQLSHRAFVGLRLERALLHQLLLAEEVRPVVVLLLGVHCGKVSSATKHQGKVVYEGEVTRQVTGIADAGVGGQIIMSQATLPLPANLVDAPFTVFDQGMHRVKGFDQPQRLKEVYPESLATRGSDGWAAKKLDTEERLSPSFHAAPEGPDAAPKGPDCGERTRVASNEH